MSGPDGETAGGAVALAPVLVVMPVVVTVVVQVMVGGHERAAERRNLRKARKGHGNPSFGMICPHFLRGIHAPALKRRTAGVSWLPDQRSPPAFPPRGDGGSASPARGRGVGEVHSP